MRKNKSILCLALVLSLAHWKVCAAELHEPSTNFQGLVLNIRCTNLVLKLGDEIPIDFVISNGGIANYEYADRNYDRSGRMPEFELTVTSGNGEAIPDPRAKYPDGFFGGLSSMGVLHPGKSFTKTIPLNLWATIKLPGQYTVTGTYLGADWRMRVKSAPINITVLPRTELEMDAYISYLTNQLAGINATHRLERDSILMKLAFTCSPKIVPLMLKEMYASDDNYWMAQALVVYVPHSDASRKEIVGMALQHGLAEDMDYVLHQYDCTAEERRAILKRSLAEATSHLSSSDVAEVYHLDVDNPRAEDRARIAHDFPKLTPKSQFLILNSLWPRARCPEFTDALLSLAKPPKEPEQENAKTLCDYVFIHLLDMKPEAVRPIILEDLKRPTPLFSLCVLKTLPDKELPELDDVLLTNLTNDNNSIWKIAPLIERYATARILPQVIDFYEKKEGSWACSLQTAMLRYWLKHDRPAALQAIERAVNFRASTGCYHTVLGATLDDSFDADAEKLARKFVNDSDTEVAADAKNLLAQHGSTSQGK